MMAAMSEFQAIETPLGLVSLKMKIGISTGKLHARGPMALEELTTYKYQVRGEGQIRK